MMRVVALTDAGKQLGERLCQLLAGSELWYKPQPFREKIQQAFRNGDSLIMICATGIVVRSLAAVIENKHQDPPVIVMDESGKFVIPLLSGHEGGANELASTIAGLLGAQLVMTTAGSYLNPVYAAGMGCERDCTEAELSELLHQCLDAADLNSDQLQTLASIDIKSDETGLVELSEKLKLSFDTYNKEQLAEMEPLLSTRSDYVFETVGVYGVAESAALFALASTGDYQPELVIKKIKSKRATCAIARSYLANVE